METVCELCEYQFYKSAPNPDRPVTTRRYPLETVEVSRCSLSLDMNTGCCTYYYKSKQKETNGKQM